MDSINLIKFYWIHNSSNIISKNLWPKPKFLRNNFGFSHTNTLISRKKRPWLTLFARNVHNPLRGCVHSEFLARRRTGTSENKTSVTLQNSWMRTPLGVLIHSQKVQAMATKSGFIEHFGFIFQNYSAANSIFMDNSIYF